MNPYEVILTNDYRLPPSLIPTDGFPYDFQSVTVLLLRILSANYTAGWDGIQSPYQYALSVLDQYEPSELVRQLRREWYGK